MSPPADAISPTGRPLPHRLPPARPKVPDPHLESRQLRARTRHTADPAATITTAAIAVKQHGVPTATARTSVPRAIQQRSQPLAWEAIRSRGSHAQTQGSLATFVLNSYT